jgi:hypothetical protein
LRAAAADLCWLLDHGYAAPSATELVGNRHNLIRRQRMAISRCVCSAVAAQQRRRLQLAPEAVRGRELWLDGYNILTVLDRCQSWVNLAREIIAQRIPNAWVLDLSPVELQSARPR